MGVDNILYAVYLKNYAEAFRCRRFGLSTFRSVDISVCRRFGLSTFRSVDVLVCRRFGCRRFGLATFWLVTFRNCTKKIHLIAFAHIWIILSRCALHAHTSAMVDIVFIRVYTDGKQLKTHERVVFMFLHWEKYWSLDKMGKILQTTHSKAWRRTSHYLNQWWPCFADAYMRHSAWISW